MDRQLLIKEILELVDSNPLNYIDIFPIIEKNSVGLDINEQRILRTTIIGALRDLRDNGDIDFNDGSFNITVTTAQIFQSSNGLIKSTLKRKEKLEQIQRDNQNKSHSVHYETHGPNSPIAGHDLKMGDVTNNDESEESKELAKAQLKDIPINAFFRKWGLYIAAAVLLTTIVLWIIDRWQRN